MGGAVALFLTSLSTSRRAMATSKARSTCASGTSGSARSLWRASPTSVVWGRVRFRPFEVQLAAFRPARRDTTAKTASLVRDILQQIRNFKPVRPQRAEARGPARRRVKRPPGCICQAHRSLDTAALFWTFFWTRRRICPDYVQNCVTGWFFERDNRGGGPSRHASSGARSILICGIPSMSNGSDILRNPAVS